jgi:hypothetical protein
MHPLWLGAWLLALAVWGACGSAFAGEEANPPEPVAVTIVCEDADLVKGLTVKAYRFPEEGEGYGNPVSLKAQFGPEGECRVLVEPGRVAFETTALETRGRIVALRTRVVRIGTPTRLPLRAGKPTTLAFFHRTSPLPLKRVSLRFLGPSGAVTWNAAEGEARPETSLVLSPEMDYTLAVVAHDGETYGAAWVKRKASSKWTLKTGKDTDYTCSFAWRPNTPPFTSSAVHFIFPDGVLSIPEPEKATLHTNRRYVRFRYSYTLNDAKKAVVFQRGYVLEKKQTFKLGGPLRTHAAAAVLNVSTDRKRKRLVRRVSLVHEDGHEIRIGKSGFDVKVEMFLKSGEPPPEGHLTLDKREKLGPALENLRVKVTWHWDKKVEVTLMPEKFGLLMSKHFRLGCPPAWEGRARTYLAKAERTRDMLKRLTKRRGPNRVHILWHLTVHNAKGQNGGADTWVDLPFAGLEGSMGYFGIPVHMAHEIMHNFGYGDSKWMYRYVGKVRYHLKLWQWTLTDHPEYEPDQNFRWHLRTMIRASDVACEKTKRGQPVLSVRFTNQNRVPIRAVVFRVAHLGEEDKVLKRENLKSGRLDAGETIIWKGPVLDIPGAVRRTIRILKVETD